MAPKLKMSLRCPRRFRFCGHVLTAALHQSSAPAALPLPVEKPSWSVQRSTGRAVWLALVLDRRRTHRQAEFPSQSSERLDPMRRHVEYRGPVVRAASPYDEAPARGLDEAVVMVQLWPADLKGIDAENKD